MPTFKVQEEVYLDKFNKCYIKILTTNKKPENKPISQFVKEMPRVKLSPFDYDCNCYEKPHCLFAFINPKTGQFLTQDNMEILVDLLTESDYNINYQLTKLVKKNNENFIFYFSS